jgi:phosphoadenosine phosphosulfate reductase
MTNNQHVDAAAAALVRIERQFAPAAFASSFGAEDMVLLDLIARHAPTIGVFTLDTGRLPEQTHALIDRARKEYGLPIDVYFPDARAVEAYVRLNGVNGFYDSVELRQACCALRKTEPLRRALAGRAAWITGLRRAQSVTRADLPLEEFDVAHGLHKFNPLAHWSEDDVWSYIRGRNVPYNELHDQGYRSIGCAPCTRAIAPGDDVRAGRWWWESPDHRECGLHRRPVAVVRPAAAQPELTKS